MRVVLPSVRSPWLCLCHLSVSRLNRVCKTRENAALDGRRGNSFTEVELWQVGMTRVRTASLLWRCAAMAVSLSPARQAL